MKKFFLFFLLYVFLFTLFAADTKEQQKYYYEQLSCNEKTIYDNWYKLLFVSDYEKQTIDSFSKLRVRTALTKDHPEIFWFPDKCKLTKFDTKSSESINLLSKEIVEKSDEIFDEIFKVIDNKQNYRSVYFQSGFSEQYITLLFLFNYAVKNWQYDLNREEDQSLLSIIIDKRGVCASIAQAFQFLCKRCGIECITIDGKLGGEPHAWNMVQLDGCWYHIDVTNSLMKDSDLDVNYSLFCVPDSIITRTHIINTNYFNSIPKANSNELNVFKIHNIVIEENENIESIQHKVDHAFMINSNNKYLSFTSCQSYTDNINEILAYIGECGYNINWSFSKDYLVLTVGVNKE